MLNHEGNVADCAGVAGLAALAHFKRPDVSLEGDIVKVSIAAEGAGRRDTQAIRLYTERKIFPDCISR